jgi:TP901 family phage tail tape measure protein
MSNDIQVDMLMNAKAMLTQLQFIDGKLNSINYAVNKTNAQGAVGATKHAGAVKGLALRFVGYNLILNEVMASQRRLYEYVAESVTKFREFETRLAEVSTIMTDDFQTALTGMKSGIENLSLSFGQSTSDLTKGLYDIMSAAFSAKDAISLLNTATKASIAGLSDVRTSVDIFTTVLNSYGMSVYEATSVSDALFQSVVRGKFQFEELESALGYVVPIAAQAGVAFNELMAALSTTTRHGLHLDMASRGLALAMQNIINPSEGAAKAAKKYGIEMSGLALRVKGISGVFGEMFNKTQEYGKIVLNELIPNMRSLRVAMVLAGEEGFEGLLDDMDKLSVASGRTEQALNKIKNTSQFASNQISQQWEQTQRDVGEAWDKIALGAQQTIANIVKDWKSFIPLFGIGFTMADYQADLKLGEWRMGKEEQYLGKKYFEPGDEGFKEYVNQGKAYWSIMDKNTKTAEESMLDYLTLQQEIAKISGQLLTAMRAGQETKVENLNNRLLILNSISAELGDTFNEVFGEEILGGIKQLEKLYLTLEELSYDIERLRGELEKPIQFGWGGFQERFEAEHGIQEGLKGTLNYDMQVLLVEQELVDVRHDIASGLADESYQYKVLNAEQQEAVRIIREHENAIKKDREETELMNIALRKLQIQVMELQLVGMIRRRGLTRSEQKRMKQLQIEQAKLRLKNMKETKEETAELHTEYYERKAMLDDYVRDLEEAQYQLEYTYDQQVQDLQDTIDYEKDILEDRRQQWTETSNEIKTLGEELMRELHAIIADPELLSAFDIIDIDILELRDGVQGLMQDLIDLTSRTWNIKTNKETATIRPITYEEAVTAGEATPADLPPADFDPYQGYDFTSYNYKGGVYTGQFARGIEYVPETGLALVHRGESISASGKQTTNDLTIEHLTIEVQQIADIGDVEKLAALLSSAKNSQLLDKNGKTRFRMRTG